MTRTRTALIVGLGIAGLAAAKQLSELGWDVTAVERSATRRTGGHFIAMFPTGLASAARIGIREDIPNRAHPHGRAWETDRSGRRRPGMSIASIPDGPLLLTRGDVEAALYRALPSSVDIRFSTTPVRIVQDAHAVTVGLRSPNGHEERRYDLVLGADGLRSTVRRLVFGPDGNHVHDLGYMVAATLLDEDPTGLERGDSIVLSEPGRSATTFGYADLPPGVLFSYRTNDPGRELAKDPLTALRDAFGPRRPGPVLGNLLEQYEAADNAVFDSVQQVRMRQWHDGRVALIGDAAWCMTLYSGLGASASIAGAELLSTVLTQHAHDPVAALPDWNSKMAPFIDHQHRTIDKSRAVFTSHDWGQHIRRTTMNRLMSPTPFSRLAMRLMSNSKDFRMKAIDIGAAA